MVHQINSGDTAWLLVCCSLVLLMTPALALFYGGMVRRKNVLSTLTLSYIFMALIGVQWVAYGYSLAFGTSIHGWIGGLNFIGLHGVDAAPNPDYSKTIPQSLFAAFQMMFAVITPALITGAFVERVRFKSFLLFSLLWATLVYDPLCHWVWGQGGWLKEMGVLDFAGGTVVHIAAGFSALAFALVIGPRRGFGKSPMEPNNIPLTVIGAGLLWVGWFGFNAGSALAANDLAVSALVVTNLAAAAAAVSWMLMDWLIKGKPSAVGMAIGAVVGLVVITPASGFVGPTAAIIMGLVGGIISNLVANWRAGRTRIDDSLDVFACHGVGGIVGAIGTGIFASAAVGGFSGLIEGNIGQFVNQLIAVAVVVPFSFFGAYALLKLVNVFSPLRVSEQAEDAGLDLSEHGEEAFQLD